MRYEGNIKASPKEINSFYKLRDEGLSVEQAARRVNYSPSWGYKHERRRYQRPYVPGPTKADPTIEEAIEFLLALHHQDESTFMRLVNAYGSNVTMQVHLGYLCERMAEYAAYLAGLQMGQDVTTDATLQVLKQDLLPTEGASA